MVRVAFAAWCAAAVGLSAAAAPPAKPLPVAVVNMAKVMGDSAPGKALLEPWKAYIAKKQGEFRTRMAEKQKIDAALENKDKPVKADEKAAMEKRASALEKEMEAIQSEAEAEGEKIESGREQIRKEAERILKEIAKEHGTAVYFDISPAPPPPQIPGLPPQPAPKLPIVLDADADLTDVIIKRLADFKVKPPEAVKETPSLPGKDNPFVALETSMGEIVVELDQTRAPGTVANFLKYVDGKHYDGTIFHRVIKGFMIQGGGLDAKMTEKKTAEPIKNEADNRVSNLRGTIAMARTGDPDSATAQFFINHADNRKLDHKNQDNFGYAVFGHVVKGMDVVDKIAAVETGEAANGMKNVPIKPVTILSAKRVAKPAAEGPATKDEPKKEEPKKEEPKK